VADVKPSKTNASEKNGRIAPGGRLEARGFTLKDLVGFAYEMDANMISGGPKWVETDAFDLVAKAPNTVTDEILRGMLKSLLTDRFKLAFHKEEQSVQVYALVPGKSQGKLKKADASTRSNCKPGAADGARTFTCQNTTMSQLADKLRQTAPGYIDHPV